MFIIFILLFLRFLYKILNNNRILNIFFLNLKLILNLNTTYKKIYFKNLINFNLVLPFLRLYKYNFYFYNNLYKHFFIFNSLIYNFFKNDIFFLFKINLKKKKNFFYFIFRFFKKKKKKKKLKLEKENFLDIEGKNFLNLKNLGNILKFLD